ncbi:DUF5684 domain-containing protein [Glaciibacter psychrotolerans]|uniref:FHA domain-containing protein n=1 Tax=Glaciibacter psychrotolerans TaxID=670054 RepID=A0A7Z0J7I4_9MICO|nr:DUF5684 domain-containing protein [Leifsonia psychrotolerans]NYJ21515.1 hypothetical protein [Leifsonia psychrotolerans]
MDNSSTAGAAVGIIVAAVFCVGIYVLLGASLAAVFHKFGQPRWKGWVPIVNSITLLELGGYSTLWVITLFLPVVHIVGAVVLILAVNNINRRFGKGGGFTVLYVFLPPVWSSILGFGSAQPVDGSAHAGLAQDERFVPSVPPVTWGGPSAVSAQPTLGLPPAPFGSVPPAPAAPFGSVPPAPAAPFGSVPPAPAAPFGSVPPAPAAPFASAPPAPPTPPAPAAPFASVPPAPAAPAAPFGYAPPTPPAAAAPPTTQNEWAPPISQVPGIVVAPSAPHREPDVIDGPTIITGRTPFLDQEDPADADELDETVITARRAKPWIFETEEGQKVTLTHAVVLLGRNPSRDTHPEAQLISVKDAGKTVSKTHARIELVDGAWSITDLHSTNGVMLKADGGNENELAAGTTAVLTEEFILGELPARIYLER